VRKDFKLRIDITVKCVDNTNTTFTKTISITILYCCLKQIIFIVNLIAGLFKRKT